MHLAARLIPCTLFALFACHGLIASAADGNRGTVFTEPPKNDLNYALQGEFVGPITVGENKYEPLGLQLRNVGGDNFEAVSFMGGLPGQESHKPKPIKMLGRRSGEFLVLSGGPWGIFVDKEGCQIIDRKGERLGRLERIHRTSPTLGAKRPPEAIVLFDGSGTDQFAKAQMTDDGLLMQGANIKPMLQDFNLHVEFRLPYMPQAEGQGRGNSGIYLMSRYECQILDSFAQDIVFNGCGALYRFKSPDLNMCLPPLVWQTYDIQFTAPRWASDGSKIRNAHVTSWINGVKVQDNVEVPGPTGAGKPEEPTLLPTLLQDHSDPVRFRNVWVIDRGLMMSGKFPVEATEEEQAAVAKPEEKKPEEKKPEEKKPEEKKPEEMKPEEKKPEEKKPEEKKPEEKKPEEKKPEEKKPEEKKPEEKKPEEKKPEEKKPEEKKPEEKKPEEKKPEEKKSEEKKS